ncbi:magnesium transporter [Clostridium niameyense]|uniref:Magnesium transporter n=1 Tax=Clostridium niameyense TaxID=1622073 RepID=A0A6M0RBA3_9CLOT|nr:hypothetical protein [Clostridium niameyense]NEZ46468.1 magnesium transporter [Clostridium niameyense]
MASNNTDMQEQIQNQMKQRLENLPRFTYRVTKFFEHESDLQKVIDDLNNNGIPNLSSRKLTDNYIEEIYEMCIFFKKEGKSVLKSAIYATAIGFILGIIHGMGYISLPFLNSVSSGGLVVSTLLLSIMLGVIFGTFTGIIMLFKPIAKIKPGYYMLTIYSDYENKQKIDSIVGKHITFQI